MITVNQQQYEWGHIDIVVMGRSILGLRGVDYKKTREKEQLYGRGHKAIGIQKGNEKCDGNLVLLQSELEAMCAAAGARLDVTQLPPIDITVAYVPSGGGTPTVDVIRGAEFTETPKGMKQGDKNAEHTLPFVALDIDYAV